MTHSNLSGLCPGCFAEKGHTNPCPDCGYDETAPRSGFLLPHRALLNEQFVVGRVLGKPGGFGVTYLGWDLSLQTRVAIKEYLPRELAGRAGDHVTVAAHSQDDGELFRFGLDQFLREARTLAQLDHPNVVRVRQFFEANGTAYLVMDYYQGLSLAEHLDRQGGRMPEDQAKQLMLPILDGLRGVHAKGFLHRDIKPQNIYLARLDSGGVRPILLDFGAARQAMGERSRSLSVVVSAGYAPFEQYHRKGNQGPWTDIYSAAAVLYRMVTGETPPEATERRDGDELKPASDFGVSRQLSDALGEGLAIAPEARPQMVQQFQARLWGDGPLPGPRAVPPPVSDAIPLPVRPWRSAAFAAALALVGLGAWYQYRAGQPAGRSPPGNEVATVAAAPLGGHPGAPGNYSDGAGPVPGRAPLQGAEEAPVADVPSEAHADGPGRQASAWHADWDNGIWARAETTPCLDSEFAGQGYPYALFVDIPLSRLKKRSDAWSITDGRALTVRGCWFAGTDSLAHAKMRRKKDGKIWDQDLRFDDGSWTGTNSAGRWTQEVTTFAPDRAPEPTPMSAPNAAEPGGGFYPSGYRNAPPPSFSCGGKLQPIETIICNDPELAKADGAMGGIYKDLRSALGGADADALRAAQRAWIKRRDRLCPATAADRDSVPQRVRVAKCLRRVTDERIAELRALLQSLSRR